MISDLKITSFAAHSLVHAAADSMQFLLFKKSIKKCLESRKAGENECSRNTIYYLNYEDKNSDLRYFSNTASRFATILACHFYFNPEMCTSLFPNNHFLHD